jgi:poly(A)-specific ribonuclease
MFTSDLRIHRSSIHSVPLQRRSIVDIFPRCLRLLARGSCCVTDMEVTRENFETILPRVIELLAKAEFYSVDFEMTGIRTKEDNTAITDSAASAFVEKNKAARKYAVVQFGLCIYVRVGDVAAKVPRYDAYPFNFFVFPGDKDGDIVINVDTAGFLAKHNMDFNKWIRQGVSFLPLSVASQLRESYLDRNGGAKGPSKWDQSQLAKVDNCDSNAFTNAMAEASRYSDRAKEAADSNGETPEPSPAPIPYFKDKGTLPIFSQFLESIGLHKRAEKSQRGTTWVMVSASTTERDAAQGIERQIGLGRLYEAMLACRKPIVVHNGLMDLLFMHHHFDGEPVDDLLHFKQLLRTRFPVIFDTRYLAVHPLVPFDPKMVQNLEGQFTAFHATHGDCVVVNLPLGFEAYDAAVLRNTSRAHEAAYDSLMTGRLLLYMAKQIGDGSLASLVPRFCNKIPVYGCLETVNIATETDGIDHDGPVIAFAFPRSAGLSSTRLDQMLQSNELRGRILWNGDRAFVFSPANSRGTLFDKSVAQAAKQLRNATTRGTVTVLRA